MKKRNVCAHTGAKREESRKRKRRREKKREGENKTKKTGDRETEREGEREREYWTCTIFFSKLVFSAIDQRKTK